MKNKNAVMVIIIALLALALGYSAYFGYGRDKKFSAFDIGLGLDLQGGVSIVYEADIEGNPTPEQMTAAKGLIRDRLDKSGYTEADVAVQGGNRLAVDIPGVDDAESAVESIGRTAMLTFKDDDGNILLNGTHVADASRQVDVSPTGAQSIVIALTFTPEGSILFGLATESNIGKNLNIYLDEDLLMSASVGEKIDSMNASIKGDFTANDADEYAALIRAGSLPFNLNVISMKNVGAKLGMDSLSSSLYAGIIGFALLVLFMFAVYRVAGLVADAALFFFLCLEIIVLSAFNITLTLPGIAGIILSVGMATDANIIIFERIKEEIMSGRSVPASFKAGFSRAFPAILDCNITTLIAGLVLLFFGTGTVRGFAITLTIGVVLSMFTALVISRLLLSSIIALGAKDPAVFAVKKQSSDSSVGEKPKKAELLKIVENKAKFFIISGVILAAGITVMIINAVNGNGMFNYDVDFSGGISIQYDTANSDYLNDEMLDIVRANTSLASAQIQKIVGTNEVNIKIKNIGAEERIALIDALDAHFIGGELLDLQDISPTVSGEMQRTTLIAFSITCVLMLVYITFRFKDIRTGGTTIIGLVHDGLIVMAAYAILRIPLNTAFLAAILTVIGYSINATIVIFDRLRENKGLLKKTSNSELMNISVSQTLRRSIYTSLSTLFTIICLYILGVSSVKDFTLPIIIGIVCGTYSSTCLVGPIWYLLSKNKSA